MQLDIEVSWTMGQPTRLSLFCWGYCTEAPWYGWQQHRWGLYVSLTVSRPHRTLPVLWFNLTGISTSSTATGEGGCFLYSVANGAGLQQHRCVGYHEGNAAIRTVSCTDGSTNRTMDVPGGTRTKALKRWMGGPSLGTIPTVSPFYGFLYGGSDPLD